MKIFWLCHCMLLVSTLARTQGFKPKEGYVPDSTTAVKVAEAVLIPVYGKRQIESEEPFNATLKDGVWIVRGNLPCPDPKTSCEGGVAEVKISKNDARILSMIHYK
jgi:hypothetical protein